MSYGETRMDGGTGGRRSWRSVKAMHRYMLSASIAGTAPLVVLACGKVEEQMQPGALDASQADAPDASLLDVSRADRRAPGSEEQFPPTCLGPGDAATFCDFGFVCTYVVESDASDAGPVLGCANGPGDEACGGAACGRGCHCKDASAHVCGCE